MLENKVHFVVNFKKMKFTTFLQISRVKFCIRKGILSTRVIDCDFASYYSPVIAAGKFDLLFSSQYTCSLKFYSYDFLVCF